MPVPAPVAARYVRGALTYRADLITEHLPDCRTLADAITGAQLPREHWSAIGRTIARFHREGVHHADLNAHNILLGSAAPNVYVLDFDRGRIRRAARGNRTCWRLRVRGKIRLGERVRRTAWHALMQGYVSG